MSSSPENPPREFQTEIKGNSIVKDEEALNAAIEETLRLQSMTIIALMNYLDYRDKRYGGNPPSPDHYSKEKRELYLFGYALRNKIDELAKQYIPEKK